MSRGKYRARGDAKLLPSSSFPVVLSPAHLLILDLLKRSGVVASEVRFASELLQNELERAFEQVTRLRLGVFLAGVADGSLDLEALRAQLRQFSA